MHFEKLDLRLWKFIQNKFSKEINLPVYTIDIEGNEVSSSGNLSFLTELIKSKRNNLFKSRHYQHLKNLEEDEISLFKFYGSINIMCPLLLHGKKIGAIVCGPIDKETYDYQELSSKLNIEISELRYAKEQIKPLNQEQINLYRRMISILAQILPKLAYQKQTKDKQINELKVLHSVIKMVNSTLELEEIMKKIMEFMVKNLNATDCTVFIKTEEGEKKYCFNNEVKNIIEIEKAVSKKAIEEKKIKTIKDISRRFETEIREDYNSMISIPLKSKQEIIGSINIYGENIGNINDENLEFISVMADQIGIAVENAQRYGEVKELAVIDKLTKAFNRRYFIEQLEKKLSNDEITTNNPLALILLDIDDFGNYNNTHGHPQGDKLLKNLVNVIKSNLREEDIIGRYGGEEFIILLPEIKSNQATETAKRIKNAVAEHKFEGGESQPNGKVTISVGLVSCMDKVPVSDLIKEADNALYKAKNTGKNKVVQRIILKNNLRTESSR